MRPTEKHTSKKTLYGICIVISLLLSTYAFCISTQADTLPDQTTPYWPMYQHDAARTGQSPKLGIGSTPEELWQIRLPYGGSADPVKGMITGPDGTLYIRFSSQLFSVLPIDGSIKWKRVIPGGVSTTPAIGNNQLIYLGQDDGFLVLTDTGETVTQWGFSYTPYTSSPAIAEDGNVYFTHGALWSLTPDAYVRWIYAFDFYAGVPPAIAPDGTIYSGVWGPGVYAFRPDSSVKWVSYDVSPLGLSVGKDGTLYVGSNSYRMQSFTVDAFTPNGTRKWTFEADAFDGTEYASTRVQDITVGPDGTIYFVPSVTTSGIFTPTLYAVSPEGSVKWKVAFPALHGWISEAAPPPIVDQANRVYMCALSGLCYGIDSAGHILWEYTTLFDGQPNRVYTAPLIASDGRMFIFGAAGVVHALIDPKTVPVLSASPASMSLQAESATGAISRSLQISSTVYPIAWTATITPSVNWISLPITQGITPDSFEVRVLLDHLEKRAFPYFASVQISSEDDMVANKTMTIPVKVFVGNPVYLPNVVK